MKAIFGLSALVLMSLMLMNPGAAQTSENNSWALPGLLIAQHLSESANETTIAFDNTTNTLSINAYGIDGSMNGCDGYVKEFILSFKGRNSSLEEVGFSGIFKPGTEVSYDAYQKAKFNISGLKLETEETFFETDTNEVHFSGFYSFGSGGDV